MNTGTLYYSELRAVSATASDLRQQSHGSRVTAAESRMRSDDESQVNQYAPQFTTEVADLPDRLNALRHSR